METNRPQPPAKPKDHSPGRPLHGYHLVIHEATGATNPRTHGCVVAESHKTLREVGA